MEFISAKDFLKQDKEVQEVFIDWWKPERGDLFQYNYGYSNIEVINIKSIKEDVKESKYSAHIIPLLTEGHLRKFIEDKIECRLSIEYKLCSNSYVIKLINLKTGGCSIIFDDICHSNLLQAYWKVACEIAKESLKQ